MIVVDTSIWISALRSRPSAEAPILRTLLDADEVALALPVRVELMSGISQKDWRPVTRALQSLPVVAPTDATWLLVETWTARAASKGLRFSVPDLLIAALADEIGALVWSLDDDFTRMAKLKMVRLYG